jgi:hypothetical protein
MKQAEQILSALKSLGWTSPTEREAPSEPFVKDVQRILDEQSAWIARPNKAVQEAIASAAIYKLQSFGWKPPYSADEIDAIAQSEREAIRAAALNEAAKYMESPDRNTYHGDVFGREIRALATMPPDYVVVKRDDEYIATLDDILRFTGVTDIMRGTTNTPLPTIKENNTQDLGWHIDNLLNRVDAVLQNASAESITELSYARNAFIRATDTLAKEKPISKERAQ